MSLNGLGQFIVNSTGNPTVSGTTISTSWANALTADLATALSTAVYKDGQQTMTANIPFSAFKATGLGVATILGDALSFGNAATVAALTATGLTDISSAAAGQIKFPATQNPSANANTLDDYEEGTFTPTDQSGASLVFTSTTGYYVKIGRLVWVTIGVTYPVTANGSQASIGGLPFTVDPLNTANTQGLYVCGHNGGRSDIFTLVRSDTKLVVTTTANTTVANSLYSTLFISLSGTYMATA